MIETATLTEQEVDTILDALDIMESRHNNDQFDIHRLRSVLDVAESAIKDNTDQEQAQTLGSMLNSAREKLTKAENDNRTQRKVTRERLTLLKAKLIMLQQDKAADKAFQ